MAFSFNPRLAGPPPFSASITWAMILALSPLAHVGGQEKPPQNQLKKVEASVKLIDDSVPVAAGENLEKGGIPELPSPERIDKFVRYMSGAKMVGRFTILGKEGGEMPSEEYTISKCEKLAEADRYRFTSRIQYGDVDVELPIELTVKWADDTPVITLTDLWLPALGTFSSRVLIYRGSYAGTWQHGDVGGHMFGTIIPGPGAVADGTAVQGPAEVQGPAGVQGRPPAKPAEVSSPGGN